MPLDVGAVAAPRARLHQVLPAQQSGAAASSAGVRRLFGALLALAVDEAGLGSRRGTVAPPPTATPVARAQARRRATARVLARRWLLGELDGEVVVPITVACGALGLDPEALADAVRGGQQRRAQARATRTNEASANATRSATHRRPRPAPARHQAEGGASDPAAAAAAHRVTYRRNEQLDKQHLRRRARRAPRRRAPRPPTPGSRGRRRALVKLL
jgi:hypothetical protein